MAVHYLFALGHLITESANNLFYIAIEKVKKYVSQSSSAAKTPEGTPLISAFCEIRKF